MVAYELAAEPRTGNGKERAHKLRASGSVPGVVYGAGGDAESISLDPLAIKGLFKTERGRNTLVNLKVSGSETLVLLKDIQIHPLSGKYIHVDFVRTQPDKKVSVRVPLKFVGKPEGLKAGGMLSPLARDVAVRCNPDLIPVAVEADVSNLDIGHSLQVKDIILPDGIEILYRTSYSVATVIK